MHRNPDDDHDHIRIFRPEEEQDELEDLTTLGNDPDVPQRPTLDAVFEMFDEGKVNHSTLVGLTDLDRAQANEVRQRWPLVPQALRESAMQMIDELGEDRFDLHFGRFLRIALEDESEIVRQYAISGLWTDSGDDLPGRLLDILRDDVSDDVRIQAALSLGPYAEAAELGELDADLGKRIREGLFAVLEDSGEPLALRRRALESVAVFADDPRLGLEIESMYEDDDVGLRSSAVFAMGRSQDRAWYPTLLRELTNDDAEVRYEAARAVGQFGDTSALPVLGALAKDEDAEVRLAAIAAIGEIGGRAAMRMLQKLAEDERPDVEVEALDDAMTEVSIFEADDDPHDEDEDD